jgi:hypothetical protein
MVETTEIILALGAAEVTGVTNFTGAASSSDSGGQGNAGIGEAVQQLAQQLQQTRQGQSRLGAAIRNVRDQVDSATGGGGGGDADIDLSLDDLGPGSSGGSSGSGGSDPATDLSGLGDRIGQAIQDSTDGIKDSVDQAIDQARDSTTPTSSDPSRDTAGGGVGVQSSKPGDIVNRTQDQIEKVQQRFQDIPASEVGAFGATTGVDPIDSATGSVSKAVGQTGAEFTQQFTGGVAGIGAEIAETPEEIGQGIEDFKGAVADYVPG